MVNRNRITLSRQVDVFQYVGYQYDWNYPAPFWCFLGKLVAKGLFDDKTELDNPNYVAIRRREFIGYTTSMWRAALEAEKAGGKDGRPPLNAIEVHFKKPRPGQPLEMIWAPARAMVAAGVGRMKHCAWLISSYAPEDKLTRACPSNQSATSVWMRPCPKMGRKATSRRERGSKWPKPTAFSLFIKAPDTSGV